MARWSTRYRSKIGWMIESGFRLEFKEDSRVEHYTDIKWIPWHDSDHILGWALRQTWQWGILKTWGRNFCPLSTKTMRASDLYATRKLWCHMSHSCSTERPFWFGISLRRRLNYSPSINQRSPRCSCLTACRVSSANGLMRLCRVSSIARPWEPSNDLSDLKLISASENRLSISQNLVLMPFLMSESLGNAWGFFCQQGFGLVSAHVFGLTISDRSSFK